jgi:toxin ParE1/3/4
MRYEFHPKALAELDAATAYYASRRAGLEVRFLEAIHSAIQCICESPHRWRQFDADVRRYLVHVFPYAVLYSVEGELIFIIAVMHCAREPGYWKTRK